MGISDSTWTNRVDGTSGRSQRRPGLFGALAAKPQEAKPGGVNRYPLSLSLAEDVFGLTDENLDPQGTLSPAELAQLRYQLFQQIIQDNTENGALTLSFATSLLGDEVCFPSVVWNHRWSLS